jgi:hypothetical protein
MTTRQNEIVYVYCHTCKDLIYKGDMEEAVRKSCLKTHTYTCGKKEYYERVYPEVVLEKVNKVTEQMEGILISHEVKGREFLFTGSHFILITGLNKKNKIAIFDDDLTDIAREYADKNTPELKFPRYDGYGGKSDKGKYINNYRLEYWTSLFNMGIWNYLEENNIVAFFPEKKK